MYVEEVNINMYVEDKVSSCIIINTYTGAGRGISTGREGPVAPVPEPVLPFRD